MKNLSLAVLAFFLLAVVNSYAAIEITIADIPFSFIADGKTYPAGTYRFAENDREYAVTIEGVSPTKADGIALIATRLAARSLSGNEVDVIFDVAGKDHYLSEIYMPDVDGFYFKSAPGKHTHIMIKGRKKAS